MNSISADDFFENQEKFKEPLLKIRALLLEFPLDEQIKWKMPVYSWKGKNVVSVNGFKNHLGVWFFNGVFLKDPNNLLINAQEGKTQSMRHLKYFKNEDLDELILKNFIIQAIENEKAGKKLIKTNKVLVPTKFMTEYFDNDNSLKSRFEKLSRTCKNEYIQYIKEAKKEETKIRRMEKIISLIKNNKELNIYKKLN